MNKQIYDKLFNGKFYIDYDNNNKPIPIIRIKKDENGYLAYNIENPEIKEFFKSVKDFLEAIGSPGTRPNAFDDQTGEDIFWGR